MMTQSLFPDHDSDNTMCSGFGTGSNGALLPPPHCGKAEGPTAACGPAIEPPFPSRSTLPVTVTESFARVVARANLVLVDPPWRYGREAASNGWHGSARRHYAAMTQRELCDLAVGEHAARDSVVLVWSTSPKLGEAIAIIKEWGFSFRGVLLSWVKTDKTASRPVLGLGRYTRSSTEFLLFGIRGKVQKAQLLTAGATAVSGLLFHPRGPHSAKPSVVYKRIADVFGGPGVRKKVELFARASNPPPNDWSVWGDQSNPAAPAISEMSDVTSDPFAQPHC